MDDIEMELDLGEAMPQDDAMNETAAEAGEISAADEPPAEPQPSKVHLRGLDELATRDIRAYVAEHYAAEEPQVEWIDDTSANLNFSSADAASAALSSLSQTDSPHPLQLRAARPSSTKPGLQLQARLAVATDRKKARAADASRFYLLHPEHDPRERRQRRRSRPRRRRSSEEADEEGRAQNFDASMYDDDEATLARRRPRSRSRSRSPGARDRNRRRERDEYRPAAQNVGKELFPAAKLGAERNAGKELFAGAGNNKAASRGLKKELFPQKRPGDEAADMLDKSLAVPFVDGEGGGESEGQGLRSDAMAAQGRGLSIKGAAGFSIKGAAADVERAAVTDAKVKELFPGKAGNRGKELFAGRRERRTAETFY